MGMASNDLRNGIVTLLFWSFFLANTCNGQKIILLDSVRYQGVTKQDLAGLRVMGDTLKSIHYTTGFKSWTPKGLLRNTLLEEPKRGCTSNTPLLIGNSKWALDFMSGYLIDLSPNKPKVFDLWRHSESSEDLFYSYSTSDVKSASKGLFYLQNWNSDYNCFVNNYYQDSCLLAINTKQHFGRKVGQKPAFLRRFKDKVPIWQYYQMTTQEEDTTYCTFNGWPRLYRYVNGHLQDSTQTIIGFDHRLNLKPILFTHQQVDSIALSPPESILNLKCSDLAHVILPSKVIRVVLIQRVGLFGVVYDKQCSFEKTIPLLEEKPSGNYYFDHTKNRLVHAKLRGNTLVLYRYSLTM